MELPVRLDAARPADVRPIALLSRALIEQGLAWRWTPEAVGAQLRDPDSAGVVARRDAGLAGFGLMHFQFRRREAHLLLLAVDPSVRRVGVGRALHAWFETLARRGGIDRIELEVRATNPGAQAFYRAQGYRAIARLRGYYQGHEDAVRMRAELTRPAGVRGR